MIIYTILIYLFITRTFLKNVGSGKPEGKKDHQKDPSDQTLLKWGLQLKSQWTRRDRRVLVHAAQKWPCD